MENLKPMVYHKERLCEVLGKGEIDGYLWFIMSYGQHPCAYVVLPKEHPYYKKHYDDMNIDCHYGLTFAEEDMSFNPISLKDKWIIGWDYAHSGDYAGYYEGNGILDKGRKYSTEEIYNEVESVIEQLKSREGQCTAKA